MNTYPARNTWKKVKYDTNSELSMIIFASEMQICNTELLKREKEKSIHPDLAYMCRNSIERCVYFIELIGDEKMKNLALLEKETIITKRDGVYDFLDKISKYEVNQGSY